MWRFAQPRYRIHLLGQDIAPWTRESDHLSEDGFRVRHIHQQQSLVDQIERGTCQCRLPGVSDDDPRARQAMVGDRRSCRLDHALVRIQSNKFTGRPDPLRQQRDDSDGAKGDIEPPPASLNRNLVQEPAGMLLHRREPAVQFGGAASEEVRSRRQGVTRWAALVACRYSSTMRLALKVVRSRVP